MKKLVIACVFLVLAGCSSIGTKVTPDQLSRFVVGQTTMDQVVAILGKPNGRNINSDGTKIITYTYSAYQTSATDFIPVVNLFTRTHNYSTSVATFIFDSRNILTKYTAGDSQMESRHNSL